MPRRPRLVTSSLAIKNHKRATSTLSRPFSSSSSSSSSSHPPSSFSSFSSSSRQVPTSSPFAEEEKRKEKEQEGEKIEEEKEKGGKEQEEEKWRPLRLEDIRIENEAFHLACHPIRPLFAVGFITGELKLYRFVLKRTNEGSSDDDGRTKEDQTNESEEESDVEVLVESMTPIVDVDDEGKEEETHSSLPEGGSQRADESEEELLANAISDKDGKYGGGDPKEEEEKDNESIDSDESDDSSVDVNIEEIITDASSHPAPQLVHSSLPHESSIRSITWSVDGLMLFSVSSDKSIATFSLKDATGKETLKLKKKRVNAHNSAINVLCVIGRTSACPMPSRSSTECSTSFSSAIWSVLITGDDDGFVKVHRAHTLECIASFGESGDYISAICPGPGSHILSVSGDGHLQVFDIRAKIYKWHAQSDYIDDDLLSVACVTKKKGKKSEREKVLVGTKRRGIHIFTAPFYGASDDHFALDHSVDGILPVESNDEHTLIVISSSDGTILLCSLWPHHLLHIIGSHSLQQSIESFSLSSCFLHHNQRRRFLVTAGHDMRIRCWDISNILDDGWPLVTQEGDEESDDSTSDETDEKDKEDEKEGHEEKTVKLCMDLETQTGNMHAQATVSPSSPCVLKTTDENTASTKSIRLAKRKERTLNTDSFARPVKKAKLRIVRKNEKPRSSFFDGL